MSTTLSEADVHIELWRSFSSLLKAYAAAASLNGTEHHVPDLDEEDLEIRAGGRTLDILYHAPTQRGQWSIVGNGVRQDGIFQLTSEGSVVLEGVGLDMDHGAIELIAKLTQKAEIDTRDSYEYQLVIQFEATVVKDFDELVVIEDLLIQALGDNASVDGHDFGHGECNIFVLTDSPRNSSKVIAKVLEEQKKYEAARVAYRKTNSECFTILWPPDLGEFRIA